jgi:hypothetical protein
MGTTEVSIADLSALSALIARRNEPGALNEPVPRPDTRPMG